jgi:hypothetical protein
MVEPMVSELGWLGISPKVCQMLEGTYDPPEGVDDATRLLIQQFRKNDKAKMDKRPWKITPEEWQSFWRGAKEKKHHVQASCSILECGKQVPLVS